jgi:hypothetical protein
VDRDDYATQAEWFSTGGPCPAPFDRWFHFLLDVAVGGNLPGSPDAFTSCPQKIVVDHVRVYQAVATKGIQVSAASLLYDKLEKMNKTDAGLSIPFENQARTEDTTSEGRTLSCAVPARSVSRPHPGVGRWLGRKEGRAPGFRLPADTPWQLAGQHPAARSRART